MEFIDKNHPSIREAFERFFETKSIEEQCTEQSLMRLHNAFLEAENKEMDCIQLCDNFQSILGIEMSRDEFQIFFKKIDIKLVGKITWDEFVSYLLIEFQDKDAGLRSQMLETPLTSLPKLLRTRHRTPVCRITFCPEVLSDRSTSFHRGCYLTVSKEGVINYWSLDLEYERTVQSKNPYLKVQSTAITDMIVLPDVQIVCTSSTECDLRFYDTAAKKFDLRMLISSLKSAVVCMHYYFSTNVNEISYIVLGDTSGSVIIIAFSPMDRGPFKQQTGRDAIILRYENAIKGELQGLNVSEFRDIHNDWTSQVAYYASLQGFVSCSQCTRCSLCICDLMQGASSRYCFKIPKGISCFALCEENHILVTGGPDCIVRVWNPFVPRRPNAVLSGHHSTICALVITDAGKRIYSLSKDKCIKLWDVATQTCIETYNKLPSELSEYAPMTIVFNTLTRTMIIASVMIAILVCEQTINETSDGFTHGKGVSCVLYNRLFQLIISTGFDSRIIVWNPWSGRCKRRITHAHSIMRYGQYMDIEITAACFDNSEQFLFTGARDGSLKMWDFNTGTCIRRTIVDHQCEITSIVWFENRILCCGWSKRVTELEISEYGICKKNWTAEHTDDILCSAARSPQTFATATYNGELILWELDKGQPIKKYQVIDVNGRYSITKDENTQKIVRESSNELSKSTHQQMKKSLTLRVHQDSTLNIIRPIAVRAMIFLTTREERPDVGTLLVAIDSGLVQVWTHHPAAGFLGAFSVIHTIGDCATSLATDPENHYLITGHKIGYIKVWLLSNYMLLNPPRVHMPLLRLEFPFLWKDRIDGRAKRAVRDQTFPLLLSSVRAHMRTITSLEIISSSRIIVSGSVDRTVRLWSFGGRYISTLGTFRDWIPILPTVPVHRYFENYRLPADIKRFASFTTLKVLHGGMRTQIEPKAESIDISKEVLKVERDMLYGKALDNFVLENYYKLQLPDKTYRESVKLDNIGSYISIYTHLPIYLLKSIEPNKTLLLGQKMEFTKKVYLRRALKPLRRHL